MIIEITGTSTRNKGAELMLVAIRQQFEDMDPSIKLAVDGSFGRYEDRARYGLLQKTEIRRKGRSRLALGLMPASFRKMVGIVRDKETDAVLDASGFAFGDQHPLERSARFSEQAGRWAAAGKPLVLLPQALGPFENSPHREAFRRIVAASRRIYAREPVSYKHAVDAVGDDRKIRMAPDFTGLVKPELTTISAESKRVCIVPNTRMLEFAPSPQDSEAYLLWLVNACSLAWERGLDPVLLLHGAEDAAIVPKIKTLAADKIPVQTISDPVAIKQYIGESHLLIGSRFHALVSALSQGVPALATSWSHKYEALFEDNGMGECVLPISCGRKDMAASLAFLCGPDRPARVKLIRENAAKFNQQTREMWRDVTCLLGLPNTRDEPSLTV